MLKSRLLDITPFHGVSFYVRYSKRSVAKNIFTIPRSFDQCCFFNPSGSITIPAPTQTFFLSQFSVQSTEWFCRVMSIAIMDRLAKVELGCSWTNGYLLR